MKNQQARTFDQTDAHGGSGQECNVYNKSSDRTSWPMVSLDMWHSGWRRAVSDIQIYRQTHIQFFFHKARIREEEKNDVSKTRTM